MAGRGPARRAAVGRARRRTASTLAVVLVASGLGYVAVASQGTTVHEAALNDSGVWVSSDAQAKFARANVPIGQLDTGVATTVAAGSGLDVLAGRCGRRRGGHRRGAAVRHRPAHLHRQ